MEGETVLARLQDKCDDGAGHDGGVPLRRRGRPPTNAALSRKEVRNVKTAPWWGGWRSQDGGGGGKYDENKERRSKSISISSLV